MTTIAHGARVTPFLFHLFWLAVLGCGQDPAAPPGATGAPAGMGGPAATSADAGAPQADTPLSACQRHGAAQCAKYAECDPTGLEVGYGDEAACAKAAADSCSTLAGAADVSWKVDELLACATALGAQACDGYLRDEALPACAAITGTRPPGGYCRYNAQCSGGVCLGPADSPCGRCVAPAPGLPAGAACQATRECERGLNCVNKVCTPMGAEGGACTDDTQCSGYLVCVAKVCSKPLEAGQSCTRHGECGAWGSCGKAKLCLRDTVVGPGQRCGEQPDGSWAICGGGSRCDVDKDVCLAPAPEGGACTTTDGCADGLLCLQGTCRAVDPGTCPADGGALAAQVPMAGRYEGQTNERRPVSFTVEPTGELRGFKMQVELEYSLTACLVTLEQAGSAVVVGPRAIVPVTGPFVGLTALGLDFPTPSSAQGRLGAVRGGFLLCGDSLSLGTEATLGGPWTLTATRL